MNGPVAYLIVATTITHGFPAQQWTAIEYPSLEICEAQAGWFNHSLNRPKPKAKDIKEGTSAAHVILAKPHCVTETPSFWVKP